MTDGAHSTALNSRVLGLDWSGARDAARKIWACIVEERRGRSSTVVYLNRPIDIRTSRCDVPEAVASWLAKQDFSLAGFDFCFGLHHKQATNFCSPQPGRQRLPSLYRPCLQAITPEQFRLQASQEMRRNTDRIAKAPFAPTNLRMYRQTYLGLLLLAAIERDHYSILPWDSFGRDRRLIIEVLPANIQRWLDPSHKSYKGCFLGAKRQRAFLLRSLEQRADIRLVQESMRDQIIYDGEGDALDAVFAAVAAQRARKAGFVIAKEYYTEAMLEGWIF